MTELLQRCTEKVMTTLPVVMRTIGNEMRRRQEPALMPIQFFAMIILHDNVGASLSLLKQHLCISLSASSKLVAGLVERGLVSREIPIHNRRRVTLSLTDAGTKLLESHDHSASNFLIDRFSALNANDLSTVIRAMEIIDKLFTPTTRLKGENG